MEVELQPGVEGGERRLTGLRRMGKIDIEKGERGVYFFIPLFKHLCRFCMVTTLNGTGGRGGSSCTSNKSNLTVFYG